MESFQLHVRFLIEWDCFILAFTKAELSKLLTSLLTAVKNMLLNTAKRYMKDLVRIYFGLLQIQVKY